MVNSSSEVSRFEEVDGVKVGDVDTPCVGLGALRPVLLHVHSEEADVDSVLLLEGEHGARPIGEVVQHVTSVHVPGKGILSTSTLIFSVAIIILDILCFVNWEEKHQMQKCLRAHCLKSIMVRI